MKIISKSKYISFFLNLILSTFISSVLSISILTFLKPWETKFIDKEEFKFYEQKNEYEKIPQSPKIKDTEEDKNFSPQDLKLNYSLAIYKDRICERASPKEEMIKPFVDTIKSFKQKLPQDVILYEMIVPSSGEFNFPKKIINEISKKESIEKIYLEFKKENIKTINLYDTFKNNKDKYIYFKTDHHWTQLGAYFAYKEFVKVANLENILEIENLEKKRTGNFLGSLFKMYPNFCSSFWSKQDFIEYYNIKVNDTNPVYATKKINPNSSCPYSTFFSRNENSLLNNKLNNNRKILVIGDSFKECFSYFLNNNYEEVVDFFNDLKPKKYPSILDLLKNEQIKEILILYSANNILIAGHASKQILALI